MQRPEDTKALERRTPITLVRMGEVARDVASKESSVCQDKNLLLCSLGTRELSKGSTLKRMIGKGREWLRNDEGLSLRFGRGRGTYSQLAPIVQGAARALTQVG